MGAVPKPETNLDFLVRDLPDPNSARLFLDRLAKDQPRAHQRLLKEPPLLADVLALAAWSPLLATTLEQNPEYLHWLARERADPRVRTCDELKESLARFALMNSSLNPQVLLARFRRRELLRTYLHDIRRSQTLVETTEELSNLADAILDYALSLARQDLDNRYGLPRRGADRGGRASWACSWHEGFLYYEHGPQAWGRQVLFLSRAAVGSAELFSRFKEAV